MISATSFLNHPGSRPPRYRTPSPPRRAVEPISPCTTTDSRASSWVDRGAVNLANHDRGTFAQLDNNQNNTDGPAHRKPGHGRSSSTIDTLATIALATSPTFAPASYRPPSQNSTSTMPLFPTDPIDSSERPAKRPRSEKDPSPLSHPQHTVAMPGANPSSAFDSMKTDAELLLNFARPSNFPPVPRPSKRVSIDESYHDFGNETKRLPRASFGPAYVGPNEERFAYNLPANTGFGQSTSRMRSQSDGSAVVSRPAMYNVRPNTSSSMLPPIPWQEEAEEDDSACEKPVVGDAPCFLQNPGIAIPYAAQMSDLPKAEDDTESEESNQASCAACHLIRNPNDTSGLDDDTWIRCDGCSRWFHIVCAGFKNDREIRTVDKFICRGCRHVYGQTTFVRKSSRARTAIDYAGLNQGLVKTATDSAEHHYIDPIRQGQITFLPEAFPRMRPELVTAEYFDRSSGMSEPIVIPAQMNTLDPTPHVNTQLEDLAGEAPTQEMFDELLEHLVEDSSDTERVIDCGQDQLDMVIPRGLEVRTVAELYGLEEPVEVIDVKSQQGEDKRWTMQKWADYYESTDDNKPVRNVISLEVSQSKLGKLIRRPKIVRDLDLQDAVWPEELKAIGDYPKVQFYVLMSVADCYTDFHIDFGGSSVYYHILKGKKTFFFIPPKDKHLKKYEEWCNSPAQDSTFLGDQTKECYRVDLSEGDTMLIPSGWIHAVWTPENSLVIGGNFLTRLNYGMQIKIAKIEKDTKVPRKFRYPFFQKIQWYTALQYLEDDPVPQSVLEDFARDESYCFYRKYPVYYEFGERANREPCGSSYHNSRFYSQAELEGLPDLAKYLLRTALVAGGYYVEGVTADARNAIKRSIPKGVTDPVDTIRKFGVWVAWKRGNEKAAPWTLPGVVENNPKLSLSEKKPAGRPSRRSERNIDSQRMYTERQAVRLPESPPDTSNGFLSNGSSFLPSNSILSAPTYPVSNGAKEESAASFNPKPRITSRGSGLGPKRVACDACRKRRIRCHHKDGHNESIPMKPMAAGPFATNSQISLAHDAASALNSLAAIASEAGLQDSNSRVLDRFDANGKYSSAVLGTPQTSTTTLNEISPEGANTGKKGRSKACDDCRKSKRRCIHDEYGRIDPVKAQERAKPRASTSKRPRPEEGVASASKRPKQESVSPMARSNRMLEAYSTNPQIPEFSTLYPASSYPNNVFSQQAVPDKDAHISQTSYASPPAFHNDMALSKDLNSTMPSRPTNTLVSPPTSHADETDVPHDVEGETEHGAVIHTPTSSSRHSSRQPRHVERYAPEAHTKPNKPSAQTPAARRSSVSGHVGRKTTPGPLSNTKKSSSRPSSSHTKKSFSPTTEKKVDRHTASSTSPGTGKHPKRDGANVADDEPDPESLRLIRELQEQEFGLRKRATRV